MSENKKLENEELEKASGGAIPKTKIFLKVGITFKLFADGEDLYEETTLTFVKNFINIVSKKEIEDACRDWCISKCRIYVTNTVIGKDELQYDL